MRLKDILVYDCSQNERKHWVAVAMLAFYFATLLLLVPSISASLG